MQLEKDPNGKSMNEPGAKADDGKVRVALTLKGFAHALWEVSRVGTFGAQKYTPNGWVTVPNGPERYEDAEARHLLKDWMGEDLDPETDIRHKAHKAWNALAVLELAIREQKAKNNPK